MSEILILEFAGVGENDYQSVNKNLGIDAEGNGSWPTSLESHYAATSDAGGLMVFEVWESKESQAEFMGKLGPALAAAGVPEPTRMEWLTPIGHHSA